MRRLRWRRPAGRIKGRGDMTNIPDMIGSIQPCGSLQPEGLRDYQIRAVEEITSSCATGRRKVLVCAPTGSGKTVIAAELLRRHTEAGGLSVFIAPRRELIDQAAGKLDAMGLHYGVLMAKDTRRDMWAPIQLASIDTLRSRLRLIGSIPIAAPSLVIVDEAHLYITKHRVDLLNTWPAATLVGLTATPARKDGRGLRVLFDKIVQVSSVRKLVEEHFLVPGLYFSLSDPDLARVRKVYGDYHIGELSTVMTRLVGNVVNTWLERAGGRRTVVFACDIAHSAALQQEFMARSVVCEHVDANTPIIARKAIYDRFRAGQTQVLTNCMLASYGFDLPELDCVVLARPTKSMVIYLQMIGRGLRPAAGKSHCLVLDHSGAVREHGFAEDERHWTLDGHTRLTLKEKFVMGAPKELKAITCPKCEAIFRERSDCPACGYFFPAKPSPRQALEGELIQINGAQDKSDVIAQRSFYAQLLGMGKERGWKSGAAAHKFKEKFGRYPPWGWQATVFPIKPGPEVYRWATSRAIAYAKSKQRESPF